MADGTALARLPACGLLNLRLPVAAPAAPAVARAMGLALPQTPCTYSARAGLAAHWLGPDEWLVTVAAGAEDELEGRLRSALEGGGAVVDVSSGYIRYNLCGPAAADVLMKASPYDFDRRQFGPGRCVQTVFAKTAALVACRENSSFDLTIRRSYAGYFERWTADALGFRKQ